MEKKFKEFLQRENALILFEEGMKKRKLFSSFHELAKEVNPEHFVAAAFPWDTSKEDLMPWLEIDERWINELNKEDEKDTTKENI